MITTRTAFAVLALGGTLLLSGCLDEQVKTIISPDGSSQRVITMKLRSKSVPERAFPRPSGPGWQEEWKEIADTSTPYEYTARKTFRTPEELQSEYASSGLKTPFGMSVNIRTRFQWFYTYVYYAENFSYRNPFGHVPISAYLTPEELYQFQHGNPTDSMKKKVDAWQTRDMFEDFYAGITAAAAARSDSASLMPALRNGKEACFQKLLGDEKGKQDSGRGGQQTSGSESKPAKKAAESSGNTAGADEKTLAELGDAIGKDVVRMLRADIDSAYERTTRKMSGESVPDSWQYSTEMPGMLLEGNALTIEGNVARWQFGPDQVKTGPYHMEVSSRVVNTWAFVVTAIAAAALLLVSLVVVWRRRPEQTGSSMSPR